MSRIIVKNLPKSLNERNIRQIFSPIGEVTDMQLKYTKDGVFRQFAFVGFKNEELATLAKDRLNNTFIRTSKIKIEMCKNLGSAEIKPWSKHSKPKLDTNEKKNEDKGDDKNPLLKELEGDEEFAEFVRIHKKGDEKQVWSNDPSTLAPPQKLVGGQGGQPPKRKRAKKKKDIKPKHLDTQGVEYTAKLKGLTKEITQAEIREFFRPLKYVSLRRPTAMKDIAYVQFQTEQQLKKALNKNRGFLGGLRMSVRNFTKTTNPGEEEKEKTENPDERQSKEKEADLSETGRIFVRNLAFSCTEKDLEELFQQYGPVSEVHLPMDNFTEKIKGFAFVSFLFPEHALKAFQALDGTVFQGRQFHLIPARPKKEDEEEDDGGGGTSFKKKKEKELKEEGNRVETWNSLFLSSNAVAELMASRYKTSKSKILGQEKNESPAVRMALGETQIVQEMKEFLEGEGVNLSAFEPGKNERSDKTLLVKNLPAGTSSQELRPIFESYGKIRRIVLPPQGVTAIVLFKSASQAKTAFKNLAFTRFHSVPLYLEWAPVNIIKKSSDTKPSDEKSSEDKKPLDDEPTVEEEELTREAEEGSTLFIKGLNFETNEESISQHFKICGELIESTVARRNRDGVSLSMGFGFVKFAKVSSAQKALKELQGSTLDGHQLQLKLSNRTTTVSRNLAPKQSRATGKGSTKILVRNVPFEASPKEIRELFSVFGELKFVRLPRKSNSLESHRGFAFVDFVTKQDAKRAMESLSQSTHLYGRRLVLEWAESDEETELETLRRKTADTYTPGLSKSKKLKQAIEADL